MAIVVFVIETAVVGMVVTAVVVVSADRTVVQMVQVLVWVVRSGLVSPKKSTNAAFARIYVSCARASATQGADAQA
jgi:hypothetical protein